MSIDPENAPGPVVRPYAMTGGRTRSRYELAIEALVFTTTLGEERVLDLALEQQTIAAMCRHVRSIAEIAAGLRVPLGVARVLVGDMADEGYVRVHQQPDRDEAPDLALLERVLSGLRKL
ncbi:DUF742 domain-containing protein [Frankia sp. Cr2]|uniref:DUF742 domain-containing protein n=1 Tax=Frankia sp. Cr2 TaxID=3073932 RepID=UPI002AD1FC9B|nr:DUF742 domain-containing protein [Frankia sp. Cr2]